MTYGGVFLNTFYPISLNLNNKLCLVVGGGNVALRRVHKLLDSGAMVKVLSPTIKDEFKPLLQIYPTFSWLKALYKGSMDLQGVSLVFAMTDNPALNKRILEDANSLGIFANIASDGLLGDFIVPSSFSQGNLQISISTSGKVPGLSKAIKENLEKDLGPEYKTLINLLEEIRTLAVAKSDNKTQNRYVLSDITANYLSILEDLNRGIDSDTVRKQLLSLLE